MRFTVAQHNSVYYVFDTEYMKYRMPEMAASIYFGTDKAAQKVADVLNEEWAEFLANPE